MIQRNIALDHVSGWTAQALIKTALAMPYRQRVRFFGRIMSWPVGPLAGYEKRIRENLALVMPDITETKVPQLCRGVLDNIGRTFIENYSHKEFFPLCAALPLAGPGWDAIVAAKQAGRPVVYFTGHFGNYQAARVALRARGYLMGVNYRPFHNPHHERQHRAALDALGPTFSTGRTGTADMVRYLQDGNSIALMADQHVETGERLRFFGRPAATSTAVARLALRYDAPLVPVYGVRRPDGLSFDLVFEAPVPIDEPDVMTQALNDSLEAMIRRHPEQWMWTHRRWKLV
ncbi:MULTISPECIES: lauroyl acyltransferase [unclassified Yoonia]|uniref:lysophospholipid acyltransferase family protein n=1 Tax=unclassified Yoonia TaxID=2629118 RepID=UPI002AFF8960|nr:MULTISPECIES: lauroyl acyltransferase [unclassified Yoonia]